MSKDPIGFSGGDGNLYRYVGNDPVNAIDSRGLSSIDFSRGNGMITINDGNNNLIGSYPAGNETSSSSNGPWPNGTFPYSHYVDHPESSKNGPYGSNGNFVFNVPGRVGMGIHSGRQGPKSKTLGCIRTTDEATSFLKSLIIDDPITSITIRD